MGILDDIGTSPRHGEDQPFLAKHIDRTESRVSAHTVLLLELLDRWQRTRAPFPGLDLGAEDGRQLLIRWRRRIMINCHEANVSQARSVLTSRYI
jgi:hypothetical protein